MLAYARWIVAHVDETKPETLAWAATALAPIDALREQKRQQTVKAEAKRAEAEPKKEEAKKETEKTPDIVVAPIAPPTPVAQPAPAPTVSPVLAQPQDPAAIKPTTVG